MATVEFIQKRIAGKERELEKLTKKLERIRKVEAQGWQDPNPYYYHESDLKYTLRDIEEVKKALESYRSQLVTEREKAASRNVPVIVEFLNGWRDRVLEFYFEKFKEYYDEKEKVFELYSKVEDSFYYDKNSPARLAYDEARAIFYNKCHGYYERRDFINKWGKPDHKNVKVKDGEYECLIPYIHERTLDEAIAKFKKDLDKEWARKYDFIIERTNAIVGQITDASDLRIGAKHDLNGHIIGTKGTAKVQTIDAGGYNIQCYHFRTLINKA